MIKLKDGSLVPSMMIAGMSIGMGGPGSSSNGNSLISGGVAGSNRRNLLQNLKNAQIQKRSANLTFDKIKQTF